MREYECVLAMFAVMLAPLPSRGWRTEPLSAGTQVFALVSFVFLCIFEHSQVLASTHRLPPWSPPTEGGRHSLESTMSVTRATTGRTRGESRQVLLSSQGGLPRGGIFRTGLKDEEAALGGLGASPADRSSLPHPLYTGSALLSPPSMIHM